MKTVMALIVGAAVSFKAACAAPAVPAKQGLDVRRLTELAGRKLSAVQKANLGLKLYRDEMINQTPRPKPPYTDPKTHDYVLAQITQKLVDTGADVATLKRVWENANPGEVKDSLSIFLGLKGDAVAKEPLRILALDRNRPMRLRELAVKALGRLALGNGKGAGQDATLGPVLAQIIREDTQGQYKYLDDPKTGKPQLGMVFPVRRAAVAAIREMKGQGMLLESYVLAAAEHAQTELHLKPRPK